MHPPSHMPTCPLPLHPCVSLAGSLAHALHVLCISTGNVTHSQCLNPSMCSLNLQLHISVVTSQCIPSLAPLRGAAVLPCIPVGIAQCTQPCAPQDHSLHLLSHSLWQASRCPLHHMHPDGHILIPPASSVLCTLMLLSTQGHCISMGLPPWTPRWAPLVCPAQVCPKTPPPQTLPCAPHPLSPGSWPR